MKSRETPTREFRFFIDRETTLHLQRLDEDFNIEMSDPVIGTIDTLVILAKSKLEAETEKSRILDL